MNKKVLVITPFFAPESHAAVFRAHKLVKYLKRYGWEPIVLTVDTNYVYKEDPNLLKELDDIPIYRARYIEPSIRGLKMLLGGRDRTFKTLKLDSGNPTDSEHIHANNQNLKAKIYRFLLNNYLQSPDRFWTWKKNAIRMAEEIIKNEDIEIVYTTCLPFTCNEIGISLKKSMEVKWVADFRDPITYAKKLHSDNYRIYMKQRRIQDLTFQYADQIVGLSSAYSLIFSDQYQGEYDHKVHFIPTGLDDDYLPQKTKKKENVLLFIGEYLKEYKDNFFKLFRGAIQDLPVESIPKIVIVGRKDINESVLRPYLNQLDLNHYVIFKNHMPQKVLYEIVERARYVLLINGERAQWWNNFAKLVDYIALKKRVIAMIPPISEARCELSKAGLGIFLDDDKTSESKLKALIMDDEINGKVNSDYCKKYLATSQVSSFVELFQNLVQ